MTMDTKPLQWLLEHINARQNPITEEQLDRFCRSPNGPILPDGLVETRRPPMKDGETCVCIEVDSTGTPCYIMKNRGKDRFRIIHDGQTWILGYADRSESVNTLNALATLGESMNHATVIGFDRDNVPISEVQFRSYIDSDVITNVPSLLFRGDQPLWNPCREPSVPLSIIDERRNVFTTMQFRDPKDTQNLVFVRDLTNGGRIQTVRFEGWKYFHESFLAPNGDLYVIGYAPNTKGHFSIGRCDPAGNVVVWTNPGGVTLQSCDHTYEFVAIDEDVHLVWSRNRGNCFTKLFTLASAEQGDEWTLGVQINKHAYLRGLQRMKSGSWAYIGTPTRHDGECWYINDREHPSFRRVSRLFLRDGYWHYYGVTMDGHHVCLMNL
jgi:hypothetical protein